MTDQLLQLLRQSPHPLRLDDILRRLKAPRHAKRGIKDALRDLARQGEIVEDHGSWAVGAKLKSLTGTLAVQRSGAAFVIPDKQKGKGMPDIFVHQRWLGDAWNGDTVSVMLLPGKRGASPEGRITGIVSRAREQMSVSVLEGGKSVVEARPTDGRIHVIFLVDVKALGPVRAGELLLVEVGEKLDDGPFRPRARGRGRRRGGESLAPSLAHWTARAVESLGSEDQVKVQEDLVKLNHSIPTSFPGNVLTEAEEAIQRHALRPDEQVEDLTGRCLVTIDGPDARDFDDAVCVEKKGKNSLLLVAIADVSRYVRPHTALDREARERGNSFYFPASVEPMLPEALSNGVCSLRPGEDKAVLFAEMEFSPTGIPLHSRFGTGRMRSRARLTYEQVQAWLDAAGGNTSEGKAFEENAAPDVLAMLHLAARLAETLITRRHKAGGLDFELPEARFDVDSQGHLSGMGFRQRLFSHRLIEAFMLAANEAVAAWLTRQGAPLLYRVHPEPGPGKDDILDFLRNSGLVPPDRALSLAVLLEQSRDTPQEYVVHRMLLRAMSQARYSPVLEGHFGLASACYCHFTSPIRRYADLINHRALRHALNQGVGPVPTGQKLLFTADICNRQERAAQEAERETARRLGCLLLQPRVGEVFDAVVSGVISFGLFVDLEHIPVEAMLRVEDLPRDYYEFDPGRMRLVGAHLGAVYQLGQPLKVRLASVDTGRLEVRAELAELPEQAQQTQRGQRAQHEEGRRYAGPRSAPKDRTRAPRSPRRQKQGGRRSVN